MSPLWSEKALAHAAWAKAVDLGLVDDKAEVKHESKDVRRRLKPRLQSCAL